MNKSSDDSLQDRIQAILTACKDASWDKLLDTDDDAKSLLKTRDEVDELIRELEEDNGSPELLQELTRLHEKLRDRIDMGIAAEIEKPKPRVAIPPKAGNPPFNPKKTDPPPLPRGGGTLHVPLGEVVGSVSVELPKGKTIRPSAPPNPNGGAGNTPIPPTEASGTTPKPNNDPPNEPRHSAMVVQTVARTSGSKDPGQGRRRRGSRDRQNDDRRTRPDVSMNRSTAPGNPGVKGAQGEKGPKGDKGDPGRDGKDGADGYNGADGRDGKDGAQGSKGDPGRDGKDGVDGTTLPQWEKFVLLMLPSAFAVVMAMLLGSQCGKLAAEEALANTVAVGNPMATVPGHASVSTPVEIEATTKATTETKVAPTEEILRAMVAKRAGRSYGTLVCYGSLDWTEQGGDVTKEPVDCTGVDSPRHADSSGRPCWNVSRCKVQVEADPAGYK